jgi:hypothetical protein
MHHCKKEDGLPENWLVSVHSFVGVLSCAGSYCARVLDENGSFRGTWCVPTRLWWNTEDPCYLDD